MRISNERGTEIRKGFEGFEGVVFVCLFSMTIQHKFKLGQRILLQVFGTDFILIRIIQIHNISITLP